MEHARDAGHIMVGVDHARRSLRPALRLVILTFDFKILDRVPILVPFSVWSVGIVGLGGGLGCNIIIVSVGCIKGTISLARS